MSSLLFQFGVWVVLAFLVAIFLAAQERWGAIKCLILGTAFPVTVPVILYFLGRKWWVERNRVKEYARQTEVTKELNDVYVPQDHVEVSNPNFDDVNPFEMCYQASADMEEIQEQLNDLTGPYICPFHKKYPNLPYSKCTCHK